MAISLITLTLLSCAGLAGVVLVLWRPQTAAGSRPVEPPPVTTALAGPVSHGDTTEHLKERLIGNWVFVQTASTSKSWTETRFDRSGFFTIDLTTETMSGVLTVFFTGDWEVQDRRLVLRVRTSSRPELVPIEARFDNEIRDIQLDTLTLVSSSTGEFQVHWRRP